MMMKNNSVIGVVDTPQMEIGTPSVVACTQRDVITSLNAPTPQNRKSKRTSTETRISDALQFATEKLATPTQESETQIFGRLLASVLDRYNNIQQTDRVMRELLLLAHEGLNDD